MSGECPLLAQSGHPNHSQECPLLGVKQTLTGRASMSLLTQSGHRRDKIAALQLDPEPHFVDRKSLL
jgi:hypothetical protein